MVSLGDMFCLPKRTWNWKRVLWLVADFGGRNLFLVAGLWKEQALCDWILRLVETESDHSQKRTIASRSLCDPPYSDLPMGTNVEK